MRPIMFREPSGLVLSAGPVTNPGAAHPVLPWVILAVYFIIPIAWLLVKSMDFLSLVLGPVEVELFRSEISDPPRPHSRLWRLQWNLVSNLAGFVEIALWPAAWITGRSLSTIAPDSPRLSSSGLAIYSVIGAIFAAGLIGLRAFAGPTLGVTVAVFGLLMTIIARQLVLWLSGSEFPRFLRRSVSNPYRVLLRLALFDFIALVLIAILLLRWQPNAHFEMTWLPSEAQKLLALRHVTQVVRQKNLSVLTIVMAGAIGLYWISLASQLIRFKSFQRDDDDRIALAALLLAAGSGDRAAQWLSEVNVERITGPLLKMQTRLALSRRRYEDAFRYAQAYSAATDPADTTVDGPLVLLANQAPNMRLSDDDLWSLIVIALDKNASDGALFIIMTRLDVQDLEAKLSEHGRTPDESRMPISCSFIQRRKDGKDFKRRREEALELLDAHVPDSLTDKAVRVVARIDYSRDQYWIVPPAITEQHVREFITFFSPLKVETFPLWLRRYVVEATWSLQHRAEVDTLANREDLRRQRQRLLVMPQQAAQTRLQELDATQWADYTRYLTITTRPP